VLASRLHAPRGEGVQLHSGCDGPHPKGTVGLDGWEEVVCDLGASAIDRSLQATGPQFHRLTRKALHLKSLRNSLGVRPVILRKARLKALA